MRPICFGPFSFLWKSAIASAGKVTILTVPREPRATDRCATDSLSGAWDNSDKVAGAEHRILTDNFAAKISYLLVYLVQAIGVAVQCPTSLRS
jgi:hypothetical protein